MNWEKHTDRVSDRWRERERGKRKREKRERERILAVER